MTLSRRSTIKAISVVGAGSALTGTALAVNEHEDDERDPETAPDDDEDVGAIRFGHFSPDAPNVDIYVDDQQILSDVAYDELSPYLEIVPGAYTVTITAAGDDEPVYEDNVPVDTGFYTAAAIGELEGEGEAENGLEDDADEGDETGFEDDTGEETDDPEAETDEPEPGEFDVLLLADRTPEDVQEAAAQADEEPLDEDDETGADDEDEGEDDDDEEDQEVAQVRFVHASPDAPTVDIGLEDTGLPIYENVAYTEPSGYVSFAPDTQTFAFFEAGEDDFEDENGFEADGDDEDDTDDVIDQPDPVATVELDLEGNQAYTAFAIGYLEEQDEEELSVEEDDYANNGDNEFGEETDADEDADDDYAAETDADEDADDDYAAETDADDADDDYAAETDEDDADDDFDDEDTDDEDDRSFSVRVALDGVMDDEADPEEAEGVEDDELEPEEDEVDEEEAELDEDEYDDEMADETEEHDENGYDDGYDAELDEDDDYPVDETATGDD